MPGNFPPVRAGAGRVRVRRSDLDAYLGTPTRGDEKPKPDKALVKRGADQQRRAAAVEEAWRALAKAIGMLLPALGTHGNDVDPEDADHLGTML
jgi:hypothetical protein